MEIVFDRDGMSPAKAPTSLILTCMDYRTMDDIVTLLDDLNRPCRAEGGSATVCGSDLKPNSYDHLVLAGGALGAQVPSRPHWRQTLFDHLEIALDQLHSAIDTVYLIDHKECGAYKMLASDHDNVHDRMMTTLAQDIQKRFPNVHVRTRLLVPTDAPKETWAVSPTLGADFPAPMRTNRP